MVVNSCNAFSGHDYSLLTVLASLGVITELPSSAGFASYITLELWDIPARNSRHLGKNNSEKFFDDSSSSPEKGSSLLHSLGSHSLEFADLELPEHDFKYEAHSRTVSFEDLDPSDANREELEKYQALEAFGAEEDEDEESKVDQIEQLKIADPNVPEILSELKALDSFDRILLPKPSVSNNIGFDEDNDRSDAKAITDNVISVFTTATETAASFQACGSSISSPKLSVHENDNRTLRIILNSKPFVDVDGKKSQSVNFLNETVIATLTMADVSDLISRLEQAVLDLDTGNTVLRR